MGDLEKFACEAMDKELLGKIRIAKTYNNALPGHIATIKQKCIRDQDMAGKELNPYRVECTVNSLI